MSGPARSRRGWLVAGGILGLALTPGARRAGVGLRARATRVGLPPTDPVERFLEAPCYEYDRGTGAADGAARTEAGA